MSKYTLSNEDRAAIVSWNNRIGDLLETLEKVKQFGVGDYLVLYVGVDEKSLQIQVNSYGAPIKYKVVHSDKHGIPFIKRVNKKGEPIGALGTCTGSLESDLYRFGAWEFRLDPDFADSILLEDSYDPAVLHRTKQDIFKAVTKHNKNVKLKTGSKNEVIEIFKNVVVGDTLWVSNSGFYLIQDKKTILVKDFNKDRSSYHKTYIIKDPYVTVLTVRDKKNKVQEIAPDFFYGKALYKERPRTYKELKI